MTNKQLLNRIIKAHWTCHECGLKYGYKAPELATWHPGKCDICKSKDSVTETRDFGYLQRGREELQKLVNAEARTKLKPFIKTRVKVKKVVQTNLRHIKKELRKVTHAIVRYGATQCYICGKQDKLSAGHFWSDGGHSNTRYDFDNLRPCCNNCNMWKHGNLAEYSIKLRKELGEQGFENLYKRAHEHKIWNREELQAMLEERKLTLKAIKTLNEYADDLPL